MFNIFKKTKKVDTAYTEAIQTYVDATNELKAQLSSLSAACFEVANANKETANEIKRLTDKIRV